MRNFSKFNLIFERVSGALIKDGGNAFTGVSRIKQQNIFGVVADFKKKILANFIDVSDDEKVFLLGSTGKKPDSGDIDIGMSIVGQEEGVLMTLIRINEACAENDIPSYINPISLNMLHVKYPQPEGFVQIDLLVTDHPDFAKFFMFSPTPEESRYKGAHRNILLKSILAAVTRKDEVYDDDGLLEEWFQYDIDDDGMFTSTKTRLSDSGELLTYKNTGEILDDEYAKDKNKKYISNNPIETVKFIFGDEFLPEDVDTFEKVYDIIENNTTFKWREYRDQIKAVAKKRYSQAVKRLVIPEEFSENGANF